MTINIVAIVVAALASFVIGFLWYSPLLFGNMWVKLMGFTKKSMTAAKKEGMVKRYVAMIVSTLVMSYVLSELLPDNSGVFRGVLLGFIVWLGFIAPVLLGSVLWEGKSVKLYLINVLHYLVVLVVMGAILAVLV